MKHSLQNDSGLSATKPVEEHKGLPVSGPRSAPQEKLLEGRLVGLKNAENSDAPILVSYDSPDPRRQ